MDKKSVVVIGGGIVGVCAALEIQLAGHQVRLVDRRQPGRETSYGNAGVLSESSVLVINNPGLLKALPVILGNRSTGVRYSLLHVLKRLPWVVRFLWHCRQRQSEHAADALRALMLLSLPRHKQLISQAGVNALLRYGGWMKLFRSPAGFKKYKAELAMMDRTGVNYSILEKDQIRQLEPGLSPIYHKAVLMDETCGVSDPAALTDAYIGLFTAAGGEVVEAAVTALTPTTGWTVSTATGDKLEADAVVLAAGAWSAELAAPLGYALPLAWERGYHLHLQPNDRQPFRRALHDIEAGYAMAPMTAGVRITSGVEFNSRDAAPNYSQIETAVADARASHDLGAAVESTPWMGRRPTMIDSLPVIGAAPRHDGLYFDFGHQHLGLSMAPGSALAIAALIDGRKAPIDLAPFSPQRFAGL